MSQTPRERTPSLNLRSVDALILDTKPWLSCDECFERMDAYAEAVVHDSDETDLAMARHLEGCTACQEEARSLIALLRGE